MSPRISIAIAAAVAVGAAGLVAVTSAAEAQSPAEFYKKAKMKIIISSSPGGGYDTYSRMLVRHMARHIPGRQDKILPVNMPGSGGLRAFNYVTVVAPKDGSIITIVRRGLPFYQVMDGKKLKADLSKVNWVCNLSDSNPVLVTWHTSKTRTLADARLRETIVGGTGKDSISTQMTAAYNRLLGTKFKILYGYGSGSGVNLAMQRGEVEGRATNNMASYRATKSNWIKAGKLNFVLQLGLKSEKGIESVPLLIDEVKGNPEKEKVARFLTLAHIVGRPIATQEGVPADRVAVLREACDKTIKDPAFIADAKKRRAEVGYIHGAKVQTMIAELIKTPTSMVETVRRYLQPKDAELKKRKVVLVNTTAKITKRNKKGSKLSLKETGGKKIKARVHSRRTKITIDGKKAKRSKTKVGMTCSMVYEGSGSEASKLDCKS
jgi:tripartite-type tricarboxylate transporter receptor subunit TctC